jgi:hypothetical protein
VCDGTPFLACLCACKSYLFNYLSSFIFLIQPSPRVTFARHFE